MQHFFSISKKFKIKIGLGIKKLTVTQIKWALQPCQLPIQKIFKLPAVTATNQ